MRGFEDDDITAARLARQKHDAFAVLSNDTDFHFFEGVKCVPDADCFLHSDYMLFV